MTGEFHRLDRVIHERARLAIMSLLAAGRTMTFTELRERLDMTDGNLSRHLAVLQDHGLVLCEKHTGEGRPTTEVTLTDEGRRGFARYIESLEAILAPARDRETGSVTDDEEALSPA